MNQFLTLLISLLLQGMVQAQSANTLNVGSRSSAERITTGTEPHVPKANESPVYVKVYGFYGLITPGVKIEYSQSQSQTGISFPFKTTNKGLGAGPRAGVGLGFIVSDFINLGVDAELLFGTDLKITNRYDDGVFVYGNSTTTKLKVLSVIPNITFKALSRPAYYIYNRLGLVGGMVLNYETIDDGFDQSMNGNDASNTTFLTTSKYTKNTLAIGYQAALGIQFRLSQSLRGFAEVVAYNQSFKLRESQVTATTTANNTATTTSTTTEFKDQGSFAAVSGTQVGQQPSSVIPMNSIGVGAGLTFRF